mmetsp:Transcript_23524/g.76534  ORF Transcript_23524/g.76534 Transcript_23524/m.76534 type:complete len:201 (-) Transcript_23524:1916-2518(-)
MLHKRDARSRPFGRAALPPQSKQDITFREQRVQLSEGIEAARLAREEHHMVLEQRDGDVPRIVRLAQPFEQVARNLGLRLAERYALQKRLDNVWPCGCLSLMVLLAEQQDHGFGELVLLLLLERCPNDREDEHPDMVRYITIASSNLLQRFDEVLDGDGAHLCKEGGVTRDELVDVRLLRRRRARRASAGRRRCRCRRRG